MLEEVHYFLIKELFKLFLLVWAELFGFACSIRKIGSKVAGQRPAKL